MSDNPEEKRYAQDWESKLAQFHKTRLQKGNRGVQIIPTEEDEAESKKPAKPSEDLKQSQDQPPKPAESAPKK